MQYNKCMLQTEPILTDLNIALVQRMLNCALEECWAYGRTYSIIETKDTLE